MTGLLLTRRRFLRRLGGLLAAPLAQPLLAQPGPLRAQGPHPAPRDGIDASRVLGPEQVAAFPEAAPVFELVREIPQVVDGIRCHCGCAGMEGFYSLLSCFEADGMARACHVCQGEARLAHRLHRLGHPLPVIRAAIDAQFAGA